MSNVLEIEEYQSEEVMSVNRSKIMKRLIVELSKYDAEYDVLPELELELSTGKCKPDVSIFPLFPDDWENDILFYTKPPITAIEIQSPKQATTDLTDKTNNIYFPAGVQSVWIIIPVLRLVIIRMRDGRQFIFNEGVIKDPVSSIEVVFSNIFK